jgi:hypothetical protein
MHLTRRDLFHAEYKETSVPVTVSRLVLQS